MEECTILLGALNLIACWDDEVGNRHLATFGSYGAFNEPASVRTSRQALEIYQASVLALPPGPHT